jgi:hypothetical protein
VVDGWPVRGSASAANDSIIITIVIAPLQLRDGIAPRRGAVEGGLQASEWIVPVYAQGVFVKCRFTNALSKKR